MSIRLVASVLLLSLSVFFFIQHLEKKSRSSEIERIEKAIFTIERISDDFNVVAMDLADYREKEKLLRVSVSDIQKSVRSISDAANRNNDAITSLVKGQNNIFSRLSDAEIEDLHRDSQLVRQAYISLLVNIEDALDKSKLNDYELERFGVLKDPSAKLGVGGNNE